LRIRYGRPAIVRCEAGFWYHSPVGQGNVDRRIAAAEWELNHVQELAGNRGCLRGAVGLEVELLQHFEVNLVLVEFVVFSGVVLDMPELHASLRSDDRRGIVVVERHVDPRRELRGGLTPGVCCRRAAEGAHEEGTPVLLLFKKHRACDRRSHVRDSAEALLTRVEGSEGRNAVVPQRLIGIRISDHLDVQ